jgi:hypothetical protein
VRPKIPVFILAFLLLGLGKSFADEKVWVGLYVAENTPPPPGATLAPEKLDHRLHSVFGFGYYELVKEEEIEMTHEWEQWSVPRKDFFIRIEPLPRQPGGPRLLDYEIFKDGFSVAKGSYEPHPDTPLFISGPDYRHGRLIFVLEAR